jgi:hypothetical protein
VKRAIAIAVLAASALPAHAQNDDAVTYRVHEHDTLELIAAEIYGDRTAASWIMAENKLGKGKQVHAGDRIKVPVTREIVTSKGDTFETLAATYLGDASRAPLLADANAMSVDDSLATGTMLIVPVHVVHVAPASESLASIAQLYLGDAKQAALLQKLNGLDKTGVEKGDSVVVIGVGVHVKPSKLPPLDAEAKSRRDEQHQVAQSAADALPKAKAAWLTGDFAGVKTALTPLAGKLDYLDTRTAIEIGLLLGKAHCAFGETDAAVAAFTSVVSRKPGYTLGAYAESPKVIAAWQKAGGHVEGG